MEQMRKEQEEEKEVSAVVRFKSPKNTTKCFISDVNGKKKKQHTMRL